MLINPEQRPLQRILWRKVSEDPIEVFQLNTVTYGTASAPYLATRCIIKLAKEVEQLWPDSKSYSSIFLCRRSLDRNKFNRRNKRTGTERMK